MGQVLFEECVIDDCDFSASQIPEGEFIKTILQYTSFEGSYVKSGVFESTFLKDVNLSFADLRKTSFRNTAFENITDKDSLFYGKKPWGAEKYSEEWNEFESYRFD